MPPQPKRDVSIQGFGSFEINLQTGELRKSGMRIRLSDQPFRVLAFLIERAGELVTREELHAQLWQVNTLVDFDHGLNNAIARIREVLDDSSTTPRYVETIPRRGYRFIAQLTDARVSVSAEAVEPRDGISEESPGDDSKGVSQLPLERKIRLTRRRVFVAVGLVATALATTLIIQRDVFNTSKRPPIKSLAVLPLKNLSGDPAQEYFADGMTEELIGRLAGIHDLRVISRTSVMRFKNTRLSAPEIAKRLNVEALVEGSVIREGSRIRVHAQLIRAAADEHFWSASYDREMDDVLALQRDMAESIADKVAITVSGREHTVLVAARHVDPEVYENYLKGQFGVRNTRAELDQSITYFENAIKKDPEFAPAYVGLARTYQSLSLILVGGSPGELRPKIVNAAQKALELDPGFAEARVVLADVYQKRWQWAAAEAEYKQALQLKPNDAAAHDGYANWLLCQGRTEEALGWARRARELDPFGTAGITIGWILFHARRYEESIRELRGVLAVHPNSAIAQFFLGFALLGKGDPGSAIHELAATTSIMHRSPGSIELLATAYGRAGQRSEALRLIDELKKDEQKEYVPAAAFLLPYLALHDYDNAFFWFERAYVEHSNILQFVKVHPFFDPVRGMPRFEDLVRRVGLQN